MTDEREKDIICGTKDALDTAVEALRKLDKLMHGLDGFCGKYCRFSDKMMEQYKNPYDAERHLIEEYCRECPLENL